MKPSRMKFRIEYSACCGLIPLFLTLTLHGAPVRVADNLLIEGYYMQEGQKISHHQLEKFLLNQQYEVANLADKSKGYRLSSFAIGGPMWIATTAVTVWQTLQFVKIVRENINSNDTGSNPVEPFISNNMMRFTLPLIIGGEVTSFIQKRLKSRSDYLLYKSVKTFDSILCTKHQVNIIIDHQIKEVKPGWFMQDRVLMPTSVLYHVLKEKPDSYGAAAWSIFCREFAINAGLVGAILITNAVSAFIEGGLGERNVNISQRNTQLGVGIGLELISAVTSVISAGIRDKAIQKYNNTLPKAPKPMQLFDPMPTEPVDYPPRR